MNEYAQMAAGPGRRTQIAQAQARAECQRLLADMAEHLEDLAGHPLAFAGVEMSAVVDGIEACLHEALVKLPALRDAARTVDRLHPAHRF